MVDEYPFPLSRLLTLGDVEDTRDRLPEGFTRQDIPDLIRLMQDQRLSDLPWDEKGNPPPEVYAQVHAWRILAQLGAVEAIPAFIDLLHFIDDNQDDYIGEEIPVMLGKLGEPAIEPARAYLADQQHGVYARVAAGFALSEIGQQHPELRDACVQALLSTLEDYRHDDEGVNAFTLSYLGELQAVEAAPLAKEIFEGGYADEMIAGGYDDFEVAVGLREKPASKSDSGIAFPSWDGTLFQEPPAVLPASPRSREKEKKEKRKRKAAKKARKRQRKK